MTARFEHLDDHLIHQGAVVGFYRGSFTGPDGATFDRDVVRHPGAVAIVPFDGEYVTLVKQYRAPIDAELIEIPAGKRDLPDEPPEITAARELEEEVGFKAGKLELLANLYHSPGFCDEYGYLYLATDLVAVPLKADSIEELNMSIIKVTLDEAIEMTTDGRMTDAKSMVAMHLTAKHVGR